MCAPSAEVGLDYADLVAAVSGKRGFYYCLEKEEQFVNILAERAAATGNVLVLLEGNVSLASIVPYQGLLDNMTEDILFQIIFDETLGNVIRYHVWLFA